MYELVLTLDIKGLKYLSLRFRHFIDVKHLILLHKDFACGKLRIENSSKFK